jgi:hypothetical protein
MFSLTRPTIKTIVNFRTAVFVRDLEETILTLS